ncbi:MAG: Lar family restriction alleviation protein [Oscillospiraceae bacterium]|nr:Lar family restriction alleviation protein [Oscillospiraceae bacterium]
MKTLKTCPFCGSMPTIKKGVAFLPGYQIMCSVCGAKTAIQYTGYCGIGENRKYFSEEMAIDKLLTTWNNRTA